ncbi:unnamed protein product [Prunus armeniaca]
MLDVVMKLTRKVTRKLEGHAKRVTSLSFLNTLNVLVSTGADAYWKLQLLSDMAHTLINNNHYSTKIYFQIRKENFLEAIDNNCHAKALDILMKDLKVFAEGLFVFVSIDWEQFARKICSGAVLSLNAAKSLAIEAIDYPCLAKKMFFPILDELKSTVTDLGQSNMCHTQWFAHYCCLTLHEGSSPMSMDFHPTWQTILPFGTCVGDIGPPWDVSSGEKLLLRNFRVWNLDAGPMASKEALVKDSYASVNHIRWSPDRSIFGVAYAKHIVQLYSYNGGNNNWKATLGQK